MLPSSRCSRVMAPLVVRLLGVMITSFSVGSIDRLFFSGSDSLLFLLWEPLPSAESVLDRKLLSDKPGKLLFLPFLLSERLHLGDDFLSVSALDLIDIWRSVDDGTAEPVDACLLYDTALPCGCSRLLLSFIFSLLPPSFRDRRYFK